MACAQGLVREDGTLLLPFYFGRDAASKASNVTVVQCSFDGREVKYLRHGTELTLNVDRGLVEPSLVGFQGKYYLTIRNDRKGYVTVGDDGLTFKPIKPWTFDDGKELGSYNTQQHCLAHSDGLFLASTQCLDLHVAPASIDRALRILDALLKALKARGLSVSAIDGDQPRTQVRVLDEKIGFRLYEETVRQERLPTPKEIDWELRWSPERKF